MSKLTIYNLKLELTYLIATSEKLLATCSLFRFSWENLGFFGLTLGFPICKGSLLPPVGRVNCPPLKETPPSVQIDFKMSEVTLPFVFSELDLAS